jgi:hypothetical protein
VEALEGAFEVLGGREPGPVASEDLLEVEIEGVLPSYDL